MRVQTAEARRIKSREATPREAPSLNVMSFNTRFNNPDDGEHFCFEQIREDLAPEQIVTELAT